ncbi:hypothetical protein [Vibrio scophthalmi]|uniref:Uncharacterized protein n=1 Tax=Vibrio scophthalmi TaxID=45658 RepID=A0A1E3WFF1_9VIBR|nr:hypothetical protein [Vibrio scophthalmi]ODS04549.1 hypothetical protein VSF3289_03688 [Vibrio scophthalmi]
MEKIIFVTALLAASNVYAETPQDYLIKIVNDNNQVVYQTGFGAAMGIQAHSDITEKGTLIRECHKSDNKTKRILKSEPYYTGYSSEIDLIKGNVNIVVSSIDYSNYSKPNESIKCENTGQPKQLRARYSISYNTDLDTIQEFKLNSKYRLQVQSLDSI